MIRVKFRFGTANRKEMSWMSETSALMDTLRQEGVSPDLLRAVEEYRTAHPLAEALRPRIPSPAFVYYGREVWEQALAALLCGENLLLAGGKATGKNVLAENLAAAFGRPAWDISFHVNMDAASLIGMDTFEGGQVKFRPGPVYRCAQSGGFGVLDEINMATFCFGVPVESRIFFSGIRRPTESILFKTASETSSPIHPTSPVEAISTPKTGSAFCKRLKENCEALIPT